MGNRSGRICPVERAGSLDSRLRRWVQNPWKIVGPYLKEGMTVLDLGCGPGFFSIEMAKMVGAAGRVIAADLQAGMLDKIKKKIEHSELEERIILHPCGRKEIGATGPVDFVLLFYMVHEVPDRRAMFEEIATLLSPGGCVLVVEPPFHVSQKAFAASVAVAEAVGFKVESRPKVPLSKAVILKML